MISVIVTGDTLSSQAACFYNSRVRTDPGKVWKIFWKFSRLWKVWKMIIGMVD